MVRLLRQRMGMTARDFATFFGVRPEAIYAWEEGRVQPNDQHRIRISALRRIYKL